MRLPLTSTPFFRITLCLELLFLVLYMQAGAQQSREQQDIVIGKICLEGNSITRPDILYRELLFKEGDTIPGDHKEAILEGSRQNLLNTSLFNFVTLDEIVRPDHLTDIRIRVVERWYIWPTPIFKLTDRNFNAWWASRDFTRVNYGFRVKWGNFRGRMENLDFIVRLGKNHQYGILYSIPYIDHKKKLGVGFEAGIEKNREVGFDTYHDKLLFLFNHSFLLRQKYGGVLLSYRGGIHVTHALQLRYQEVSVEDTLLRANPDYFFRGKSSAGYFSIYYKMKADFRDANYYPLSGWYIDFEASKTGLGFPFEEPVRGLWIRSTSRLYVPIAQRWYFGGSIIGKATLQSPHAYFLKQGLGYERDFVRGYEYYVVDGNHYLLTRNSLKFALLPERNATLPFIPTPKFSRIHFASYLTLNADAGFVWAEDHVQDPAFNELTGTLLAGGGLGLDLVTYYDKVLRIEYSINKSGESGIFIHFIAGI